MSQAVVRRADDPDLEFCKLLPAKSVLGKHASDRGLDDPLRVILADLGQRLGPETAGET